MNFRVGLLTIFFCLGSLSLLNAQEILDKEINIQIRGIALEMILYEINKQVDNSISYSSDIIPSHVKVNIKAKKMKLHEVLSRVLKGTKLMYIKTPDNRLLIVQENKEKLRYTLSGYIFDSGTGEALIGATVYSEKEQRGVFTNNYGFFSLTLDAGIQHIETRYLGYTSHYDSLIFQKDQQVKIEMEQSLTLTPVIVSAKRDYGSFLLNPLSSSQFDEKLLQNNPSVGGEKDLISSVIRQAGIQSGADGYGGYTVRGGNVDQNLVLIDGVPVYNSVHALGLYSIFNPLVVKSAVLYKGVPAPKYKGRISSVLDVYTKEGNNKNISGQLELGALSTNIMLEGPFHKGKGTFVIAGRRSLMDLYSRPYFRNERESATTSGELGYYFFDLNSKLNYTINNRNKLFLSIYNGLDIFEDINIKTDTIQSLNPIEGTPDSIWVTDIRKEQNWGNFIGSFRFNHLISDKVFANFRSTYTRFFFQSSEPIEQIVIEDNTPIDTLYRISRFNSKNQDFAINIDLDFHTGIGHVFNFGVNATRHWFQPRIIKFDGNVPVDTFNQVVSGEIKRGTQIVTEYDFYVEDKITIQKDLMINIGLKLSRINTSNNAYNLLQPRTNVFYKINNSFSISASAGKVIQAVHLLTTTGRGRPEDLWVGSSSRFGPIESWQYVLGLKSTILKNWNFEVEGYYKTMKNLLAFQEGIIQNIDATSWQNSVIQGIGKSYGLEFSLSKLIGWLQPSINYTLAWSNRTFAERNQGYVFRHQFDRRHKLNLILSGVFKNGWNSFINLNFQSSALTTLPQGSYYFSLPSKLFPYEGSLLIYSELNNTKLPLYFRCDVGMQKSWHKKRLVHQLRFGINNIFNYQNASFFSISENCNNSEVCLKQTTLVPILPFLLYSFKF